MNWDLMMNVGMSMLFFAPLLIALGLFLFMGVLVAFEGAVALGGKFGANDRAAHRYAKTVAPGPIAAGLEEAVKDEAGKQDAPAADTSKGRAAND